MLGFFGVLAAMLFTDFPPGAGDVLKLMIGALGAMTVQVGNYFFGSSVGSKRKTELMGTKERASA